MTYTFIARSCLDLPVAVCCRVMKVSTSGFYAWRAQPCSDRDFDDAVLTNTIVDIHTMSPYQPGPDRSGPIDPERRLYAVLATQNDDRLPHVAQVMFLYDKGCIFIETGGATRKARNAAARRHASVLVQTPSAAWVLGVGPATILSDPDAERHRHRIGAKYLTAAGQAVCGDLLDEMDDVIILVEPAHWLSRDLSVFMEDLATRGVDPTEADNWFLGDD